MKSFSLYTKIGILLLLVFVLLFPIGLIMNLIKERASYQNEVISKIKESTSGEQTIYGPYIVVPYEIGRYVERPGMKEGPTSIGRAEAWHAESAQNEINRADLTRKVLIKKEARVHYILPEILDIDADAKVEARKLGIYQAQIYNSKVNFKGKFVVPALSNIDEQEILKVGEPYLAVGVADTRGIGEISRLVIGGQQFSFQPGTTDQALPNGVHATIKLNNIDRPRIYEFSFNMQLQGTNQLSIAPVGASTTYLLQSNWPHPSFNGDFLPTTRNISEKGFNATWHSSWLASNINTQFIQKLKSGNQSQFSVPVFTTGLIKTVDQYQLNQRVVKYAILFIGLTFSVFFLFEILKSLKVHPVQYSLVGLSLVMFYLLLLALSEHISFNLSYLIASMACVFLLTYYVSYVLQGIERALGFGGMLSVLYAALWGLLQSEDNALLLGSVLLFTFLSVFMITTRKLNWYGIAQRE